jgi:hypothetical protein
MFEAGTPGLLPVCPQCGGPTVAVVRIEPVTTFDHETPTQASQLKIKRDTRTPV